MRYGYYSTVSSQIVTMPWRVFKEKMVKYIPSEDNQNLWSYQFSLTLSSRITHDIQIMPTGPRGSFLINLLNPS